MSTPEKDPGFLAGNRSQETQAQLSKTRRQLLLEAHNAEGLVPIESLSGDEPRITAAVTLVQEGFVTIDEESPDTLQLTDQGQRWARGVAALHGR